MKAPTVNTIKSTHKREPLETRKRKYLLKYSICFVSGILIGILLYWSLAEFFDGQNNEAKSSNISEVAHQSGFRYINPLLDFTVDYKEVPKLKTKIEKYINKEINKGHLNVASIYFRKMNSGLSFYINESERFSPASLLKVPLMIACLKQAEVDPRFLFMEVEYSLQKDNGIRQNISNEDPLVYGNSYSIDELVARLIINSDNEAGILIQNALDPRILEKVYSDLNLINPSMPGIENFMTVREYSKFMRILYNSTYLNREMSEYALFVLSRARFKGGLVRGISSNIEVAHKFGEREIHGEKQLHDCGIIYYNNGPCMICIMTRGKDFDELKDVIGGITKIVTYEVEEGRLQ